MEIDLNQKLEELENSEFRKKFKLTIKDINYINEKSLKKIRTHAYDFIRKRIAAKYIKNDGKQTPLKGHPVFVAQHATGTCCRKCLERWHNIPQNKRLDSKEVEYIVNIIMLWVEKQYKGFEKCDIVL